MNPETAHTIDIAADVDFRIAEAKHSSCCANCAAEAPIRIGLGLNGRYGCSECVEYPRCYLCRRWTGDGDFLPSEMLVTMDGAVRGICSYCWESSGVSIPLDMTEDDDA